MKNLLLLLLLLSFFSCKRTNPCPDEDTIIEVEIPGYLKEANPYLGFEKLKMIDIFSLDTFQLEGNGIQSFWSILKTNSPNVQCQRNYKVESQLVKFTSQTQNYFKLEFKYEPFSERPSYNRVWIISNICNVSTVGEGEAFDGFPIDSLFVQGVWYKNIIGITDWRNDDFSDTVFVSKESGIIKIKSPKGHWELLLK